jgi:phospholipase C
MQDSGKGHLSRRTALGLGLIAIAGCGTASEDPAQAIPDAGGTTDGGGPPPPPPPTTDPDGGVVPPALTAKELLAGIDHVVVLMMENRSFDHMLGALKTDQGYAARAQVEGLTGTESNLSATGTTVQVHRLNNFEPIDPPHEWDECHAQFNGGKNDGFVKEHEGPSQTEVMGFHDRTQIPFYYWLADNFTICDHWFASVMGPTWPNRFYLHAGTSAGTKDVTPFFSDGPDTLWDRMKELNLGAKNYAAGSTSWYIGAFIGKATSYNPTAPIGEFFTAAQNGTLPPFSVIDPDFSANDDHPSHNIKLGQAFVASIYKAIAESPAWFKTLLIVTYDEHGGFFDHVPPPKAPDDSPEFEQFGFRVPAFVIGPTVRKGHVCKTQLDHTSVGATLRTRFGLKHLSFRMDKANDIADAIDPKKVTKPSVPPQGMPVIAMRREDALRHRVGPHSQPVIADLLARGVVQPVDGRSDDERIGDWFDHAARLGAVRVIR